MPDSVTINFGDGTAQAQTVLGTAVSHVYTRPGNFGVSATGPAGRGQTLVSGPGTFDITATDGNIPRAVGATAGTPGEFTPAGCATPATAADITDLVASPATPWTVGQWVQAVNGDQRYWNGSAWTPGQAPPPVATGATAGAPGTFTPAGAAVPATGADIVPLAATPATSWSTGQYVAAANADERYWSGSSWQNGRRPAPVATGATAGTPGTFTPNGATTPATGAAIETLTASPTTAWTPGQYVAALNADERYWNSGSWQPGKVPTPVAATGATAGTPGTFTPVNFIRPANLAAMATIVASPATVWTTGQSVITADTESCHWDGTDWIDGVAP